MSSTEESKSRTVKNLDNKCQLIVYPNRIGETLEDLYTFMRPLKDSVGGVHILPMYPSNSDGGFSPLTHLEVDPEFGNWADIERLTANFEVCVDITLNHISDESKEFQDFLANGQNSKYKDLFVDVPKLYGKFSQEDLAKIHIRKEKEPFLDIECGDGYKTQVWNTFSEQQIDLNYESPLVFEIMEKYIKFLSERGIKLFRLDAFGYITIQKGTRCFLIEPKIWEYLSWFVDTGNKYGVKMLPEVHDHPKYQKAISERGAYSYGFALPPLVLYSLLFGDASELQSWLQSCPHNQITVLDTHDGITMPDVEDLLSPEKQQLLIDELSERSADPVLRKSAADVYSVGGIYQLTSTFYEALKRDDNLYLMARAIQLFTPGIPQVYYEGLLAGVNNLEQAKSTGDPREVNRGYYTLEEVSEALHKPVVQQLLELMKLRNSHPAFNGRFRLKASNSQRFRMVWESDDESIALEIDLEKNEFRVHSN